MKPEGRSFDVGIKDRVKADVAVALAVTHHLILVQNYDLSHVFKVIGEYSTEYVLIEFMPIGLFSGHENKTPKLPSYYNLSWFEAEFKRCFEYMFDESLDYNRHLFVGKVKGRAYV